MIEAHASEAEASLNALLDDEASRLRILDYLRKSTRRQVGTDASLSRLATDTTGYTEPAPDQFKDFWRG